MATVINKREVSSVEGKVKVIQKYKIKKEKKLMCFGEFGPVNSTI